MPEHPSQRTIFEVSDLRVDYPGFTLGPVDLSVTRGAFLTLVGPNGSGKSTLIRSALGLQVTTAGSSWFGAHNLAAREPEALAQVGYVTDSASDLLSELTTQEYWQYCRAARASVSHLTAVQMRDNAARYADVLRLPITSKRLSDLSLGTRRKVQIISVLMTQPSLLIIDEGFSGLDFLASRALESLLAQLWRAGTTVVTSSHDLDLTARLSTHIALLFEGQFRFHEPVERFGGPANLENAILEDLRHAL